MKYHKNTHNLFFDINLYFHKSQISDLSSSLCGYKIYYRKNMLKQIAIPIPNKNRKNLLIILMYWLCY